MRSDWDDEEAMLIHVLFGKVAITGNVGEHGEQVEHWECVDEDGGTFLTYVEAMSLLTRTLWNTGKVWTMTGWNIFDVR